MPKPQRQRTLLSIFIGSPGDLQAEREIARNVIDRINKRIARHLGVQVELRGWEDTLPGYSRPQAVINEDLKECDMFLGLLWQRWGTRPSEDGEYTSGFEEEYYLALELREKGEMQEIMLFFKDMSEDLRHDPGEQASKVIEFRHSVEAKREVLYSTFDTPEAWKEVLYDILAEYLTKHYGPSVEIPEKAATPGWRRCTFESDQSDSRYPWRPGVEEAYPR